MELFDPIAVASPSTTPRYIISALALVVAVFLLLWYPIGLRFHNQQSTMRHFMNEVETGEMEAAYRTWKPAPSYSFEDFLEDWRPNVYQGAIESYKIESIRGVRGASSVAITVAVSPYRPFPQKHNQIEQLKTRKVTVWIDPKDESISFPPCGESPNPRPCA
jgi:hypothetical protein